jgi:hypothetical protein
LTIGGPHMRLQGELDVDHAEVVCVAAGAAGLALALGQPPVLVGLQNDLSRPLFEHVEGLHGGHRQELGGRAGARLFRPGDLGGLLAGDVTAPKGGADLAGACERLGRLHRRLGLGNRGPRKAGHLAGVVELAGQQGLAKRGELFGPGVVTQQLPGRVRAQQLGLESALALSSWVIASFMAPNPMPVTMTGGATKMPSSERGWESA